MLRRMEVVDGGGDGTQQIRVVGNAREATASARAEHRSGAVWRVTADPRDLDANIIHLPAGDQIYNPEGPDRDVLLLVVAGGGTIDTGGSTVPVATDDLVWLPRHTGRLVTAGPDGLSYFSVHQRREALGIRPYGRQ